LKILIIQSAFIGDVILATPVISGMIRCFPGAQVDVLVRKGNESLLNNFPGLNEVLIWNKNKEKYKNLFRLLSRIRIEKYDVVINLQRFAATGFLTAFSGGKQRIGFSKNPFSFLFSQAVPHQIGQGETLHETSRNLSLISFFGAVKNSRPLLYPSVSDFEFVREYQNQNYYCIAPTSVWFTKQVPAEKWIELIKALEVKDSNTQIFLLGGPSDFDACQLLLEKCANQKVVNLAGTLSFLQTAALMYSAKRNFVNDSAPLHIASAMNAPVSVFYCSTIPAFGFGPLSDDKKIIEVQGLNCRPCGLHGFKSCPEGHFKCALNLNTEASI